MNVEKSMDTVLTKEQATQFGTILKEAVSSYMEQKDSCSVHDWLKDYLTEQLPTKSAEEISAITDAIVKTVDVHSQTIESLRKAQEAGKSVEAWFQEETAQLQTNGQRAYSLTNAHAELTTAENQCAPTEEQQEVLEVEVIPPDEWNDGKWNKYRMKELVTETVRQAGDTALRTTASELYEKATELGFQAVLTDKEIIKESLLHGADAGIKAAVSGAMEVASERGLLPDPNADTTSRSMIACMTIENVKTLERIAKGEISLTQGLKDIRDTSAATLATIVKTKVAAAGAKVGQKIGAAVGAVFGPMGTAVGAFVGGAVGKMAGTAVGSKIVETAKKVGAAAKTVVSKVTSTVRSVASSVRSGFRRLFGR